MKTRVLQPRSRRLLAAVLLLTSPLASGAASALDGKDDRARSDIEFARGLASKLTFVDLAEEVLEELQSGGISNELAAEIGLARCEVFAAGAKRENNSAARSVLFGKSLEAYGEYLDENPLASNRAEAQRSFISLSNLHAQDLQLQLEDLVGEAAQTARETILTVLTDAVALTGDLIAEYEGIDEITERQKIEMYDLMLNRGQMLHGLAKASEDGEFYFGRSAKTLEDLALRSGENSWFGLRAYLELASVYATQARYEDAVVFFEYVIDEVIPRDAEKWDAIREAEGNDPASMDKYYLLSAIGLPGLIDAHTKNGQVDSGCRWALHYYNLYQVEGFEPNRPFGYLAMLSIARALLASEGHVGGSLNSGELSWYATESEMSAAHARRNTRSAVELALKIAQKVNEENKKNTLQIMAQNLIAEIVERPGVEVSIDMLFQAAQGDYYSGDLQEALHGFHRILASVEGDDLSTRLSQEPRVLLFIGKTFMKLDRHLEAAMTLRTGLLDRGGKDDTELNHELAAGYYAAISQVRRAYKGDKAIDDLWREAEDLVVQYPEPDEGPHAILFRQAKRSYDEGKLADAREKFQKLPEEADHFESAIVHAAVCAFKLKDIATAVPELTDYIERRVTDPSTRPATDNQQRYRDEARAMATFYLGLHAFTVLKDNERVVELFGSFHDDFPGQTSYAPSAMYQCLQAYLTLGRTAEAKALMAVMVERFSASKHTGSAAFKIYQLTKAGEPENYAEQAFYLGLSNSLRPDPTFAHLREESKLYMNGGDLENAEKLLRNLKDKFADDPSRLDDLTKFVIPDLGRVLLDMGDVNGALQELDALMPEDPDEPDETRKPTSATVMVWCRAAAGHITGDEAEIIEHPGIGGEGYFELATKWWNKLAGQYDSWTTPEWYEAKFNLMYTYYRWGEIDSNRKADAKAMLETFQAELGPLFSGGGGVVGIAECMGGDKTLENRYRWLAGKLGL